jgi:GTP-binding protein
MQFIDEVKIYIQSGKGGNGCVSFRREKNIPLGGPDGGDGGKGGDIIFRAVGSLNTLIDFRYKQHYKAANGEPGKGSERSGKSRQPVYIDIPIGTQIFDETDEIMLADLTNSGQEVLFLEGGKGGLGNVHFKSSVNRSPRETTKGEEGQASWVWMKLKLLADAGIIGLPNAGKSTFLSVVSDARPKIADYPFTTLEPKLGVVHDGTTSFVLADIPGLIAGAHMGVGLGDRFLKHVERCSILLHLIDGTCDNVVEAYQIIREEIRQYKLDLVHKKELIALNKCDSMTKEVVAQKIAALSAYTSKKVYAISALDKTGLKPVLRMMAKNLATTS